MKKNYLFGLMVFIMGLFVFSSCSSDDDDELNFDEVQLVGKWINTRIDWNENGELDYETYSSSNRYLKLDSDGTGSVSPYNLFEDEKRGIFEWSVSKNKLTIVENNGDITVYIIVKLNNNELVLRWEDYEDDDDYLIETHTFKKFVDGTNE